MAVLQNVSLANALGRPDLAFRASGGGTIQTAVPQINSSVVGATPNSYASVSGPIIGLGLLVVALVAFGYWVRPQLA